MILPAVRRATYQDIIDLPEHKVGEIIDGELFVQPRPAVPHANAGSVLGFLLGPPFHLGGSGGPGGWVILFEPELHFSNGIDKDVLVPDIAGWRRERMPEPPRAPYITLAPDWVCEVLSPSTTVHDRTRKMRVYARERVQHLWFIEPERRTLEVFRWVDGAWTVAQVFGGEETARAEPFEAVEISLASLWIGG